MDGQRRIPLGEASSSSFSIGIPVIDIHVGLGTSKLTCGNIAYIRRIRDLARPAGRKKRVKRMACRERDDELPVVEIKRIAPDQECAYALFDGCTELVLELLLVKIFSLANL